MRLGPSLNFLAIISLGLMIVSWETTYALGQFTANTTNPSSLALDAQKAKEARSKDLQKKVANAYKDTLYLSDFGYLNDPEYQDEHLGERLKLMPVGDGTLSIGGQHRLRYHHEQNIRGLGLTGRDDDFVLDRTRIFGDYRFDKSLRIYSEFLDSGSSFENFAPRAIEVQHLDIQNLFADVLLTESAESQLSARLGRQEIQLGNQRLVSPLDWSNTRRRFDGGRLTWTGDLQTLDAILLRPERLDIDRIDPPELDQVFYGLYHSRPVTSTGKVDTYYFGFQDEAIDQRVHTLGCLIAGETDQWIWDNEFGYQFGQYADGAAISAGAVTLGFGQKLEDPTKPRLIAYYDWASGGDTLNHGWNHLFPLVHRYNGFMDLFGRRNLHDFNVLFTNNPHEKWSFLAWYHYFLLADGDQGPYNVNLSSFNPGGSVGSRDLGHEIDLLVTYKKTVRSEFAFGYSHFFAGRYYETSLRPGGGPTPLFSGDADFFYTQYTLHF